MEGKGVSAVIICVLVLGLVVAEARTCCRNPNARSCFTACRQTGGQRPVCSQNCDCLIDRSYCPPTHPAVEEGWVNEAVEHYCVNACSELCNNGAMTALATA